MCVCENTKPATTNCWRTGRVHRIHNTKNRSAKKTCLQPCACATNRPTYTHTRIMYKLWAYNTYIWWWAEACVRSALYCTRRMLVERINTHAPLTSERQHAIISWLANKYTHPTRMAQQKNTGHIGPALHQNVGISLDAFYQSYLLV